MADKKKRQPAKKKVQASTKTTKPKKSTKTIKKKTTDFPIVGLGASAGGLEALEAFFSNMPANSNMAFVIIQHLSPKHKSIMASLLSKSTKMPVNEIKSGTRVEPNRVYLNPPDKNVVIQNGKLQLMMPIKSDGLNLPIDCFFKSMASDLNEKAVCVILSGTATDGTLGLKAIKGNGGIAMVQDLNSAKYDGMPRSAIATGIVDFILPVEKLPGELVKYIKAPYITSVKISKTKDDNFMAYIQTIFALIRKSTGHDLSHYKQTTIRRRIERRMAVHQIGKIDGYVKYLEKNDAEVEILFKDMLIGVTNFFRDPEAFEILKSQVLPGLFKSRQPDSLIRIWIVGCSTGEEAYSMTIILLEVMDIIKQHHNVQVFASDIDADAIEQGRLGVYPDSIAADVSQERLNKYFTKEDNTYRIKKQIREMVIFAVQNVIKDPPFSKIDMVSCRNLLIYLDTPLQKKVMPLFHYILRPDGVMLLGTSESIGEFTDFFSPFNNKWKIFKKMEGYLERAVDYPVMPFYHTRTDHSLNNKVNSDIDIQNVAERVILSEYSQPGVLVNEHYEIVHFLGKTDKYLETPIGKASFNVLSMAREGLRYKLSTMLNDAIRQKKICTSKAVRVKYNGSARIIDLTVRPLQEVRTPSGFFLVMFDEKIPDQKTTKSKGKKELEEVSDPAVKTLEQELNATKEHLQTTIEELETSNEELKSTNEELQSVNEELQSTNEELETSKEELQSTNEELVTVNTELQKKVDELSDANNDINNLLASTEIGTIFLDIELNIKRFTPAITKIFNLIVTDAGRSISDITAKIPFENLFEDIQHVLKTLEKKESEVQTKDGEWYSVRAIPYRTLDNVIDGVVVTFNNITLAKKAEFALRLSEQNFMITVKNSSIIVATVDINLRYIWIYNPHPDFDPKALIGKRDDEIAQNAGTKALVQLKQKVIKTGEPTRKTIVFPLSQTKVTYDVTAEPIRDEIGNIIGVTTASMDISDRVK
jgi:two-component system, chemotaxis family, CheB/CheR fusion protein